MENFFFRSVEHKGVIGSFLWSEGYIVKDYCIYKDGAKVHTLSFRPTFFQVLEHEFLVFNSTDLFSIDRAGHEELVGTFESVPLLSCFNTEESLLVIVLKGSCVLLNDYFEVINTVPISADVYEVLWNFKARLVYISTSECILVLNERFEVIENIQRSGHIALRTPNVIAVAKGNVIRFIERNTLEFGEPLRHEDPLPSFKSSQDGIPSEVKKIEFIDRNTLVVFSEYITIYFAKNNRWYRKLQRKVKGKPLGVIRNTIYIEDKGLLEIKIFKEFTKVEDKHFVVDGDTILFYDYGVSIIPPPFCNKTLKFPGPIKDISLDGNHLGLLMDVLEKEPDSQDRENIDRYKNIKLPSSYEHEQCFQNFLDPESRFVFDIYNTKSFLKERSVYLPALCGSILEVFLRDSTLIVRTSVHIYIVDSTSSRVKSYFQAKNILKMHFFDKLCMLDLQGRMYTVEENLSTTPDIPDTAYKISGTILFYSFGFYNGYRFVQINDTLLFGRFFVSGVVSFLVHKDFLFVSKHDRIGLFDLRKLDFIEKADKLDNKACICDHQDQFKKLDERVLGCASDTSTLQEIEIGEDSIVAERNSVILCYSRSLILYIPRGSIESFKARPVVIDEVKQKILEGSYDDALDLSISNCIEFNIWLGFKVDIQKLALSKKNHLITLFTTLLRLQGISASDPEKAIQVMSSRNVTKKVASLSLKCKEKDTRPLDTKCLERDKHLLSLSLDPLLFLSEISFFIDNKTLVEILINLELFPVALFLTEDLEWCIGIASNYMKPEELVKSSLLIFNLDLSIEIATMMDRKYYIEEFKKLKGPNQKFRILDYLKMHEKALDLLVCNAYCALDKMYGDNCKKFSLAMEYIEKHGLHEYSMRYGCREFTKLYASKLLQQKDYKKSFEMYKQVDLHKALDVSFYLESECTIEVGKELGILSPSFYKRLVESLVTRKRFGEAASIKKDMLGENAMSYFLSAGNIKESFSELKRYLGALLRPEVSTTKNTALFGDKTKPENIKIDFSDKQVRKDPLYIEFIMRIKNTEDSLREKLVRKASQITKYRDRMESLEQSPCALSETTFSYSVSGSNIKVNEEEFLQKRLETLKEDVLSLKVDDLAAVMGEVGVASDISQIYNELQSFLE